jgi:hypothetical protein
VVRDGRSGRWAVLWESGKRHCWFTAGMDVINARSLPQDCLIVNTHLNSDRSIVYPSCGIGEEAVKVGISFFVRPEAGQEGVPARDKLWRLAGADAVCYDQQVSLMYLCFHTNDRGAVGSIVWSAGLGR